MTQTELTDFAARYADAWSSRDPARLAAFYAENGSLTVNAGTPAVGRKAVTAMARSFMTAFPDMIVRLDVVVPEGSHVVFRWIWTGTNTGPGGTGRAVRIRGCEEWTLDADGRSPLATGRLTAWLRSLRRAKVRSPVRAPPGWSWIMSHLRIRPRRQG